MQRTTPTPISNAGPMHPRKRRRLALHPSPLNSQNTPPRPSIGTKRSRSTSPKPTISLKRRPTSPHISPPPCAKRQRVCDKPDIDMTDVRFPTTATTTSRRPACLHNVLRKERASTAMLREMHVRRAEAVRQQAMRCAGPIVEDSMSETLVSESPRGASSNLKKEEEVLEEVDASESTEIPREPQSATPGVQAALLQDGRCAVQIVREDGTTQIVVIEPPETDGGEYAWYA